MKLSGGVLILFLVGIFSWQNPLQEAQKLLQERNYTKAIPVWREAIAANPSLSEPIEFNLAQTLFLADSTEAALSLYQKLQRRLSPEIRSIVWNQSGVILATRNQQTALEAFRKALLENPNNEFARYNYELLLRKIRQQEPPPPPPPPSQIPPPSLIPPTEASANLINDVRQTPEEIQAAKKALEERQVQYIQQIRKKMKGTSLGNPQW
ncbi:MAG: hypothetical protein NZ108_03900 [Bacteroidia bacterium]|nr:hypothetical protein [Bacteroidia bacterium]